MQPGRSPQILGQSAAVRAATANAMLGRVSRTRIITPPPAVLTQVVKDLVLSPPTHDEMRLLTEIGTGADTLVAEEVEAQLEGTRLLELLRLLARNDTRILAYLAVLLAIMTFVVEVKAAHSSPSPAPNVTVKIDVDTDEIVRQVEEKLKRDLEQHSVSEDHHKAD